MSKVASRTMSIHMLSDDPSKLEEFVDGRLPAKDERQIELHLETCEECRSRLESIVGAQGFWRDAAAFLADDKFDGSCEAIFRDSDLDLASDDGLALVGIAKFFDA